MATNIKVPNESKNVANTAGNIAKDRKKGFSNFKNVNITSTNKR